jgi:hypothetical protein
MKKFRFLFMVPGFLIASVASSQTSGGIGDGVQIDQTQVSLNPILKRCLNGGDCPVAPEGQVGHPYRIFVPGGTQETTGFYSQSMVWIAKKSDNPPPQAKFLVEAWFAPLCSSGGGLSCTVSPAGSLKFFYQVSAVNQSRQGERRIQTKNNFSAPRVVSVKEVEDAEPDPLASIMLTGDVHSFADCLNAGSGTQGAPACVIGFGGAGSPMCLNTSNIPAMQQYSGNSYCAFPSGCPAGWTDVSTRDQGNPCGTGICCQ